MLHQCLLLGAHCHPNERSELQRQEKIKEKKAKMCRINLLIPYKILIIKIKAIFEELTFNFALHLLRNLCKTGDCDVHVPCNQVYHLLL